MTQPLPKIHAITDTNVLLDIYSCHDVIGAYNRAYERLGPTAIDEPAVIYRRVRARESILLALYFHRIAAHSYSLHAEVLELLTRRSPPAPPGQTIESDFTTFFLHFVKDSVLPAWRPGMPVMPGNEARSQADQALVNFARSLDVPLITNEGYTQDGIVDQNHGLRPLARDAGVQVFAPREFYAGKIDEVQEIEDFLRRFREQAPAYIDVRRASLGPDDRGEEVLNWIYGYYRMVLLGDTTATPTGS
jgi:hypothetical protein